MKLVHNGGVNHWIGLGKGTISVSEHGVELMLRALGLKPIKVKLQRTPMSAEILLGVANLAAVTGATIECSHSSITTRAYSELKRYSTELSARLGDIKEIVFTDGQGQLLPVRSDSLSIRSSTKRPR